MAVLRLALSLAIAGSFGLSLAGCSTTVGECIEDAAPLYAVDPEGRITFAGQALVHSGCAAGRCHDEGAEGEARHGVPMSLDFGLPIARLEDVRDPLPEGHRAQIERSRTNISKHAEMMLRLVEQGSMPPGEATSEHSEGGYRALRYHLGQCHFGDPLPAVTTEAGREILRNWLACGAPTVEAADPTLPYISGSHGQHRSPLCEEEIEPGLMSFERLYAEVFQPSCALSGCHDSASGDLRMDTIEHTYDELFGRSPADTTHCDTEEARDALAAAFVVPGDPDASYLLHKMTDPQIPSVDRPICGDPMPKSGRLPRALEKVRAWIEAGAPGPQGS